MKSILFLVYLQGVNGKKWKNFMKSAETITQWEKFRWRLVKLFYTRGTQDMSRTLLREELALGLKIIAPYAGKSWFLRT